MRASRCFAQGQDLAANGQLDEALIAFEEALAQRPQMPGAHLHYALALSEADRPDDAVSAMQKAIESNPQNAVLPMFLGQILFDHADYPGAQSWFEQSLAHNPQQLRSRAYLALVDLAQGRVAQGYEQLQQTQSPSLSTLERWVLTCGIRQPPVLYQQASSMWQSRLLTVVESHLMRLGNAAQTLADQLIPNSPEAEAIKNPHAVDRVLTPCVMAVFRLWYRLRYSSQPNQRDMWLRYADAEEAYYTAQPDIAVAAYEALMPAFPEPERLEQRLYEIAYAQGDFNRAWPHWQRWADDAETKLSALDQLQQAELQYQVGDYEGAKTSLDQMTTLPWRDFRVPYYQGLDHLRTGAMREARRCFTETARRLNPDIAGLRLDELHRLHQAQANASVAPPSHQVSMPEECGPG